MTDCFALFDEPRRPWLDPESLKEKFHRLSAVHHPDVAKENGVDFSGINAAYQTLRDPKTRIRHLLELDFPGALTRNLQIPSDIARLFETMTRERHGVADFLEKSASLQTPLEIALLAPDKLELLRVLDRLLEVLAQKQEGIFTQLQFVDAVWEQDKAGSVDTLLEIYQGLSYVGKWLGQVREDWARLKES
jgi:curved DNA-binding protein CbpA